MVCIGNEKNITAAGIFLSFRNRFFVYVLHLVQIRSLVVCGSERVVSVPDPFGFGVQKACPVFHISECTGDVDPTGHS